MIDYLAKHPCFSLGNMTKQVCTKIMPKEIQKVCIPHQNISAVLGTFLLGSQFLTDLRDNIFCLPDKVMKVAGQHDYGYFLIEVCFSFFDN
jgi:hypothetical protein